MHKFYDCLISCNWLPAANKIKNKKIQMKETEKIKPKEKQLMSSYHCRWVNTFVCVCGWVGESVLHSTDYVTKRKFIISLLLAPSELTEKLPVEQEQKTKKLKQD